MAVSLKREFCSLAKPMAAFVAIPFAADIAFLSAFLLMLAIEGSYGGAAGAFAPAASSLFAGVYAPVCAGAVVFCPFAGFVYLLARFAREARASFESCAKRHLYNFKLTPSLTLGCGSWGGNSVSENVGLKAKSQRLMMEQQRQQMHVN